MQSEEKETNQYRFLQTDMSSLIRQQILCIPRNLETLTFQTRGRNKLHFQMHHAAQL